MAKLLFFLAVAVEPGPAIGGIKKMLRGLHLHPGLANPSIEPESLSHQPIGDEIAEPLMRHFNAPKG